MYCPMRPMRDVGRQDEDPTERAECGIDLEVKEKKQKYERIRVVHFQRCIRPPPGHEWNLKAWN